MEKDQSMRNQDDFRCPNNLCQSSLVICQNEYIRNKWKLNLKTKLFKTHKIFITSIPYCFQCQEVISTEILEEAGMKHILKNREKAFGTQFYTIYEKFPNLYHEFSLAEDEKEIILNTIKKVSSLKKDLLDIGSGTGKYINLLSSSFRKIFALDPSESLLKYSIRHNKEKENILHLKGGGENIPLPSHSIDVIISTWGAFPINETLSEIKRVLKPKGMVIRIGASRKDEFTSLMPLFNENAIIRNNSRFKSLGFKTIQKEIIIRFKKLITAKITLSKILGIDESLICKNSFKHKIVIQTLKT